MGRWVAAVLVRFDPVLNLHEYQKSDGGSGEERSTMWPAGARALLRPARHREVTIVASSVARPLLNPLTEHHP